MSEFLRRIKYLLHRRRFDRELAHDLEFHREMAAREGSAPLGHDLLLREQARDAWGWTWMDRLAQDLGYAARMLRKSPGFAASAVLMLALGIGVNVAAFGFFDLMFLRPLPVREPATLLRFNRASAQDYADNFTYPEVAFYREHATRLSAVMAVGFDKLTVDGATQIDAHFVTANFFNELGARAKLGRLLDVSRDEAANAPPVVVLSAEFWQRHFAADAAIVGQTIRLNAQPATVIGVASSEFSGLAYGAPALWAPIAQQPYFIKGSRLNDFSESGISVMMSGRLAPGASPRAAEAELASLAAELHRRHPKDVWEKESVPSKPGGYANNVRHEMAPIFALVGALAFLILAAACANLGGLLLARGVAREREIAIRVALGAGRLRLIRQLFTESLVLALLGSAAGLLLGYAVMRLLSVWAELPAGLDVTPDRRVVAFAMAMGFAAAILFGLAPACQTARPRHRGALARQFLTGAQLAASCILLIVAALLVRALDRALFVPWGFEYEHLVTIDPHFHGASPDEARLWLDSLEARLRGLPGVEAVSMVSNPPLGHRWTFAKAEIRGRSVNIHYNHIDPPFFSTMRIPLLRGRNLTRGDTGKVVAGDSLARLQWPAEDPIGKEFRVGTERLTVVGVVGSARLVSPEDSDAVEIYQLAEPSILPSMVVLVRTAGPPEAAAPLLASTARSIDPKLFPEVQLMKSDFRDKVRAAEYSALAVSVLGLVALLLACAGIGGLVAYGVSQRTKEIGIRMALGAQPADVLSIALRQFARPVAIGLLTGVGGAAALSQVLRQSLYGVGNLDPLAYLAAIALFVVTVAVAALLPARRALGVDPLQALRHQ